MRSAACVLAALALAGAAAASERRPTLAELESELVCPTCETTLDQSNAPIAGVAAGATALAFAARRWTRVSDASVEPSTPSPNGAHPVDPELERRIDEELARLDA